MTQILKSEQHDHFRNANIHFPKISKWIWFFSLSFPRTTFLPLLAGQRQKAIGGILSCSHLTRYSGHCSRSHILYSQSFFEVYVILMIKVYESEGRASPIPSVLLTARQVAMLLQRSLGPFHFHADKRSTWCEQLNSWKNRLGLCNWPCILSQSWLVSENYTHTGCGSGWPFPEWSVMYPIHFSFGNLELCPALIWQ